MADLTCYRLRAAPKGPVADFDDAIDEDDLARLVHLEPTVVGGARAKLYIAPAKPEGCTNSVPSCCRLIRTALMTARAERNPTTKIIFFIRQTSSVIASPAPFLSGVLM